MYFTASLEVPDDCYLASIVRLSKHPNACRIFILENLTTTAFSSGGVVKYGHEARNLIRKMVGIAETPEHEERLLRLTYVRQNAEHWRCRCIILKAPRLAGQFIFWEKASGDMELEDRRGGGRDCFEGAAAEAAITRVIQRVTYEEKLKNVHPELVEALHRVINSAEVVPVPCFVLHESTCKSQAYSTRKFLKFLPETWRQQLVVVYVDPDSEEYQKHDRVFTFSDGLPLRLVSKTELLMLLRDCMLSRK